jgi:signal recognition particle GTPase
MNTLPILRIELEGVRANVAHMLNANNESINKMVLDSLEKQLTEEWVQQQIDQAVKDCLHKSIVKVADDWQLQNAITQLIGEAIAKMIAK